MEFTDLIEKLRSQRRRLFPLLLRIEHLDKLRDSLLLTFRELGHGPGIIRMTHTINYQEYPK